MKAALQILVPLAILAVLLGFGIVGARTADHYPNSRLLNAAAGFVGGAAIGGLVCLMSALLGFLGFVLFLGLKGVLA